MFSLACSTLISFGRIEINVPISVWTVHGTWGSVVVCLCCCVPDTSLDWINSKPILTWRTFSKSYYFYAITIPVSWLKLHQDFVRLLAKNLCVQSRLVCKKRTNSCSFASHMCGSRLLYNKLFLCVCWAFVNFIKILTSLLLDVSFMLNENCD